MIEEQGVVIARDRHHADVLITKDAEECGACKACEMFGKNTLRIHAYNGKNADVGDRVKVVITESRVIGSVVVYILPLLFMVGGYYLMGYLIAPVILGLTMGAETAGIIGAFLFLVCYFLFLYFVAPKGKESVSAKIEAVLEKNANGAAVTQRDV